MYSSKVVYSGDNPRNYWQETGEVTRERGLVIIAGSCSLIPIPYREIWGPVKKHTTCELRVLLGVGQVLLLVHVNFPEPPACPQEVGFGCQRKSSGRKVGCFQMEVGLVCTVRAGIEFGSVRNTILGAREREPLSQG